MEKKFNWDLPADPDPKSDNYYNGIVSKELKDSSDIAETLLGVIRRESVKNQSDFVNEGIETILDRLGIKSDKPLTRKEKLLAFIGFKAGLMCERLVEIRTNLASPDPIEMVIMGILKNGKNADFYRSIYRRSIMFVIQTKTYTTMRTVKSVLIVTRMGYIEGVFTSFRALANSRGATRINIEGEYEPYTETELKDIAVNGQTFTYFGKKCRISARTLNI